MLLHVPVLLLQLRYAACKLFLEVINHGPVSSWPIALSPSVQSLSLLRLSQSPWQRSQSRNQSFLVGLHTQVKSIEKGNVVVHACHPSTKEAEAGVQDQPAPQVTRLSGRERERDEEQRGKGRRERREGEGKEGRRGGGGERKGRRGGEGKQRVGKE